MLSRLTVHEFSLLLCPLLAHLHALMRARVFASTLSCSGPPALHLDSPLSTRFWYCPVWRRCMLSIRTVHAFSYVLFDCTLAHTVFLMKHSRHIGEMHQHWKTVSAVIQSISVFDV